MKTIVEKIQNSLASIKEISHLSGVSYHVINNWMSGKSQPKGRDISLVQEILTKITNLNRDQIKLLVEEKRMDNARITQALKIATGNSSVQVTDLADDIQNNPDKNNSKKAPGGEQKKPLKHDENQLFSGEEDENNDINLPSHQNDQNMNDLIAAQRDAAKAVLLMAESQKKLVDMLERKLDGMPSLEGIPKGEPLATK